MLKLSGQSLLILSFLTVFLSLSPKVFASVRCETQYGGGQKCVNTGQIHVNKEIFDPTRNTYADNLSANDHVFKSGDEITFRIKVSNIGDADLTNVTVTDSLPSFLLQSSGDYRFNIDKISPGSVVEKILKAKVVSNDKISQGCDINVVVAQTSDQSDRDSSQVCVQRPSLAPTLPSTGPETTLWLLTAFGTAVVFGVKIKNYGKK